MSTCAAYGCSNKPHKKIPGVTFHKFPVDPLRRAEWIKNVRRVNYMPTKYSQLCSDHFTEDMIDRTSLAVVRLRENAVPTIFHSYPRKIQQALQKARAAKLQAEIASAQADYACASEEAPDYEESTVDDPHAYFGESGDDDDISAEEIIAVPESAEHSKDTSVHPNILRVISADTSENVPLSILSNSNLSPDIIDALTESYLKNTSKNTTCPAYVMVSPAHTGRVSQKPSSFAKEVELQLKLDRTELLLKRCRKKVKLLYQQNRRQRIKIALLEKRIKDYENNRTTDEDVSEDDISEAQIYSELLRYQEQNDEEDMYDFYTRS